MDTWNEEYQPTSRTKGKFFTNIFPRIPRKTTLELKSEITKSVNCLITKHILNKVFLARIGTSTTDHCDAYGEVEINIHLIFQCSKFQRFRQRHSLFNEQKCLADPFNGMKHDNLIKLATFIQTFTSYNHHQFLQ